MFTSQGEGSGSESDGAIDGEPAGDQGVERRPPRRWLAVLLGLFFPGLGYFHLGFTRRAIVTALCVPALPMLLLALGVHRVRLGALIIVASMGLCLLYPAIHVLRTRRVPAPVSRSRAWSITRYPLYIVLYLLWYTVSTEFVRATAVASCVRVVMINGHSMTPGLLEGDRLVINTCRPVRVSGGDIAMFRVPGRNGSMLKRVAASEGQSVQVTRDAVLVDNRVFMKLTAPAADNQIYGPITVPRDAFFVIGENLPASADSRHFGSIPASLIQGRVVYVLWSPLGGIRRIFTTAKLSH
jgi:signal peptidase I